MIAEQKKDDKEEQSSSWFNTRWLVAFVFVGLAVIMVVGFQAAQSIQKSKKNKENCENDSDFFILVIYFNSMDYNCYSRDIKMTLELNFNKKIVARIFVIILQTFQ